jgi:hypothetical protein
VKRGKPIAFHLEFRNFMTLKQKKEQIFVGLREYKTGSKGPLLS